MLNLTDFIKFKSQMLKFKGLIEKQNVNITDINNRPDHELMDCGENKEVGMFNDLMSEDLSEGNPKGWVKLFEETENPDY
jgi:hypothetical protein